MRNVLWLFILIVALAFIGCSENGRPEAEEKPLDIPYSAIQINPDQAVQLGDVKVKGVKPDTVEISACELAQMANEQGEVTATQLNVLTQHKRVEAGKQERIVMGGCTGTKSCTFLCGGRKYQITGIPDGCYCVQTFGGSVVVWCSNDCPWGQAVCTKVVN